MSYKGKWNGTTFRSLLELSFMRHMVEDHGFTLGTTMLYEEHRIRYGRDGKRTYVVDFSLPDRKQMIEIKPSSRAMNRNNLAKRRAAQKWCRENGWEYFVVTEKEIYVTTHLISLEEAGGMHGVVLNDRARRALRRKMAKWNKRKKS